MRGEDMDTNTTLGPATPPDEAALLLYQEAMTLWRAGEREATGVLLDMAQACALVSLARTRMGVRP
jgi:hypothetical protein